MKREDVLASVAALLVRTVCRTVRVRPQGVSPADIAAEPSGSIYCFWHNRIVGVAFGFLKFYPPNRRGVTVLTSASRDGQLLGGIMRRLGMGAVHGSSSRRGAQAQRELVRLLGERRDVAVTPDGPRGPRYVLGPGVIQLAMLTGAPVFPVHASCSRALRLKTWDGFIIPLPFSTVSITVDAPLRLPRDLTDEAFEQARKNLETQLTHGAD